MDNQEIINEVTAELLAIWYAAEDCGESDLVDALGEANALGEHELAGRIFAGAVRFAVEQLMFIKEIEFERD